MTTPPAAVRLVRAPLHGRAVLRRDGAVANDYTVHCPMEDASVDARGCATCARARAYPARGRSDGGEVLCEVEASPERDARERTAARGRASFDLEIVAAQTPLHEIMEPVVAVELDVAVATASRALVEHGMRAMTVVDQEGKPVGILSQSDLLRERVAAAQMGPGTLALDNRTVAEVMTPVVHTLPENARLAHAFALLAIERVHQVPVVSDDGHLVGVVSSAEALRWLVRRMGYVV